MDLFSIQFAGNVSAAAVLALATNGMGVAVMLLLLYAARTKSQSGRVGDRLLPFMACGLILGCLMETVSLLVDGKLFAGARLLNYAANTYIFTFNVVLPFCLLVYVDLGLYGDLSRIRKKYKPQSRVLR